MATPVTRDVRQFAWGSTIRRLTLTLMLASALAACGPSTPAGATLTPSTVTVHILYLDHAPVRPVLSAIDEVLARYGNRVAVQRYNADNPDGMAFAKAHSVTEHTPLAIFINGSMEHKLDDRMVKFYSFPQGQGTGVVADGAWTTGDFEAVLAQVAGSTP